MEGGRSGLGGRRMVAEAAAKSYPPFEATEAYTGLLISVPAHRLVQILVDQEGQGAREG